MTDLLAAAKAAVEQAEQHPGITELLNACQQTARYFMAADPGTHWFCEPDNNRLASKSILAMSFERAEPGYRKKLEPVLARCADCARIFHMNVDELSKMLRESDLPAENVTSFLAKLEKSDVARLSGLMEDARTRLFDPEATDDVLRNVARYVIIPTYECLCADLLITKGKLLEDFKAVLFKLESLGGASTLVLPEFLPGTMVLLFGEDAELHNWAKNKLLRYIQGVPVQELAGFVVSAFERLLALARSKKEYTDATVFWRNMDLFLGFLDRPVIVGQFGANDSTNVTKLLSQELAMMPSTPLHSLLRCLKTVAEKLETDFWKVVPIPSRQLAGSISTNPQFASRISVTGPINEKYDSSYTYELEDLFDWSLPFLNACNSPTDQSAFHNIGEEVARALINLTENGKVPANGVDHVKLKALQCFNASFRFDLSNKLPLLPPEARIIRADLKAFAYNFAIPIIQSLSSSNVSLVNEATRTIDYSIRFDVASGMPDDMLKKNQLVSSEVHAELVRQYSISLWDVLNQKPRLFNEQMASMVLRASQYSAFITHPPLKKDPDYKPKKQLSEQAVQSTVESLKNISDLDGSVLKVLITQEAVLTGLFIQLFSANPDQNQAAVDILCQAFDTDIVNRFHAIEKLLSFDLRKSLTSYCSAVEAVVSLQMFSPCSQLTKVAQDVSSALYGARGVVDNSKKDQFTKGQDSELVRFWNANWSFLKFTFQRTYTWASLFKSDFMLEFMKDQLDYCQTLLDTFRLVEADIESPPDAAQSTGEMLALPAINTVESLSQLLRLKDEALLHSCYVNIMTIVELMKSFKLTFPEKLVQVLKRLATREIPNVIPRQKIATLLATTGIFSNDDIDELLNRVEGKSTAPSTVESSPQPAAPVTIVKHAAPSTSKSGQRSLTDFMQFTSGPAPAPKIPPPAPSRSKAMDEVREALKNNRPPAAVAAAAHKPIPKEIHPARPAGFNSRRLQPTSTSTARPSRAADSSSESSGDEEDIEGLFSEKPRTAKPGIIRNIDKPMTVTALNLHRQRPVLSQREREQRNMRLRLNIDMGPLYQRVLTWNYHSNSAYPDSKRDYDPVEDVFSTTEKYQKVFEPLLMLECWQGIIKAKEENSSLELPFTILIGNRVRVDSFVDVYASMDTNMFSKCKLTDSDLIVLTYFENEDRIPTRPDSRRPNCLAKIKEIKTTGGDFVDLILRAYQPDKMSAYLGSKFVLHGLRVSSMTTIEREYASLKGLPYYDMVNSIIKAEPAKPTLVGSDKLVEAQRTFGVNESQAGAILSSINSRGFSLIQGPPGTGKTKTILGIIGAHLTNIPGTQVPGSDPKMGALPEGSRQVLICAPSNAAVDELVLRLKAGVVGFGGKRFEPNVVRLGRSEAINSSVKELTLEDQVDKAVAQMEKASLDNGPDGSLRQQQTETVAKRNELRERLADASSLTADEFDELDLELRALNRKIKDLGHKLDLQREQSKMAVRKREFERRRIQEEILRKAQVICSTLSGSAHNVLVSLQMTFETVVIDEAAQSIELSALIPLKYGCKRCIMVGDPNQLPPTVLSQTAANLRYEQSLFVRMFKQHQDSVHMLNTQFRMHPEISQFPSREFYKGLLKDGPDMARLCARPWHSNPWFGEYRFYDIKGRHQKSTQTKSIFNKDEAVIALELFDSLTKQYPDLDVSKIGIISPYKSQVRELKNVFQREHGELITKEIDFNTIDGFQGQEKEIIILSCVRAQEDAKGVGFLSDTRRMNVAITRAKCSLWILGNEDNLTKNPVWWRLIGNAKRRGMFSKVRPGFTSTERKEVIPSEPISEPPSEPLTSRKRTDSETGNVPRMVVKRQHFNENPRVALSDRSADESSNDRSNSGTRESSSYYGDSDRYSSGSNTPVYQASSTMKPNLQNQSSLPQRPPPTGPRNQDWKKSKVPPWKLDQEKARERMRQLTSQNRTTTTQLTDGPPIRESIDPRPSYYSRPNPPSNGPNGPKRGPPNPKKKRGKGAKKNRPTPPAQNRNN
ncbi:helicase Sen1p [Trichomonascus vanleenenianus]|uniref:DNA/RNA helicase SEN1 n=1 Tax=Trichomonascus vanleenenianus TaxID=2268995 RepID=UPI003ECB0400